jgi:hypothetical protein
VLLVCERLSASEIRIVCDDTADDWYESFMLVEEGVAVSFRMSTCDLSASVFQSYHGQRRTVYRPCAYEITQMDPQQEDARDNMQHIQSYCVSEKCGER